MRVLLATRYPDYDTKGHVNNAVFLTYFEMARSSAWVERMGQDGDFPFVLAEATVRFVSQARIGEPLDIEITTAEVRTKAWVWAYTIRRIADDSVVAEGSTVQVMYDYGIRRAVPIPDRIRAGLGSV